jgi:hypothetical protein
MVDCGPNCRRRLSTTDRLCGPQGGLTSPQVTALRRLGFVVDLQHCERLVSRYGRQLQHIGKFWRHRRGRLAPTIVKTDMHQARVAPGGPE